MGDSLLNDGPAFVFLSIFKLRYLYLLDVEGVGEDVGWAKLSPCSFNLPLLGPS